MNSLLGIKTDQSQKFLENGKRIPVTQVNIPANLVVQVKTDNTDGYTAIQFGIGTKKQANKPLLGHVKADKAPKYLREVRIETADTELPVVGATVSVADVFKPGDIIDVTGISKGKGFAGGVKRYHFRGGPKTHGQSDRHRAPGSIGQGTTPGRVYKGKKMAGNMGNDQVTVKSLLVVAVNENELLIKGLVPGVKNSLIIIKKVSESKNFTPLFTIQADTPAEEQAPAEPLEVAANTQEPVTESQIIEEVSGEAGSGSARQTTEPEHTEEVNEESSAETSESTKVETQQEETQTSAEQLAEDKPEEAKEEAK